MSKRSKGSHGVYSLTCISQKCGRKFGVMWELENCVEVGVTGRKLKTGYWTLEEAKMGVLVYPFTGCPWCGVWWCTGPLDAAAYPSPPPLLGHRHVAPTQNSMGNSKRVFKCGTWWPIGPLNRRAY